MGMAPTRYVQAMLSGLKLEMPRQQAKGARGTGLSLRLGRGVCRGPHRASII